MSAGHEGGHFLMAGLDEFNLAVGPALRYEHAIDAVAGVTEDAPYAPLITTVPPESRLPCRSLPAPVLLSMGVWTWHVAGNFQRYVHPSAGWNLATADGFEGVPITPSGYAS